MTTINVDDRTEIPETYGNAAVEWGEGNPMILWEESLKFHTERVQGEGFSLGEYESIPQRVEIELTRLLGDDFSCHVSWSDWEREDGYEWLEFEVWPALDLDPTMEQDKAYTEILWPAIATLFNVTDPGTFNSEYLFDNLITREE